ncbi:hypothetical protein [Streptomyces sp. A1136]|uniref:hypothetical protein n=1 Tax=Streptomyces sp. A1136 TaxID=2563102 RepID=UPI00109EA2CA|nr:hypothetical protein [Streptomyces sp. A1136]THA56115.1 hypothetical protein E6R62_12275 [Streptomyces sp. A1136]
MRIRLTDGTRHIDIQAADTPLTQLEATALHLLAALPPPLTDPPDTPQPHPIGFTCDVQGVSLDSTTERADPEPETLADPDDEDRYQP